MNNNFMGYFNPPPGSMNSGPGFPPGSLGPQGSFSDMPVNMGGMLGPTNTPQQRLSHYENMQLAQVQSAGAQPRLQPYMNMHQSNPFGTVSGMSPQGMPQYDMRMPSQGQDPLNLQSNASFVSSMQQWPRMPNAMLRHKQMMMQQNMEQNLASLQGNEDISFGSPQPFPNNELLNFNKLQSQEEPQPLQRQASVYNNFPFGPQPFGSRGNPYQSYEPPRLQQSSASMPPSRRQSASGHYSLQQNPMHESQMPSSLPHTQNSLLFRSSMAKSYGEEMSKVQPQSTAVPHSPKLSHFGPSPNTSVFDIPGSQQRVQKIQRFPQSPPFGGSEIAKGMAPSLGGGMQSRLQPDSSPVMTPPRATRLPSPNRLSSPTKVSSLMIQMQQIQQKIRQLQESRMPQAASHISLLQHQLQSLYRQSMIQKSNSDFSRPPSIPSDDRGLSSQLSPLQAMSMQLSPLQAPTMQQSPMSSSPAQPSPLASIKRSQDEQLLDFQSIQPEHPVNIGAVGTPKSVVNNLGIMRRGSPLDSVGRLNDGMQGLDGKDNSSSLSSIEKITSISNMVDLNSTPPFDSFTQSNTFVGLPNDADFSPSTNIPLTQLSNLADEIGIAKLPGNRGFGNEKQSQNTKLMAESDNKMPDIKGLPDANPELLLEKLEEPSISNSPKDITEPLPFSNNPPDVSSFTPSVDVTSQHRSDETNSSHDASQAPVDEVQPKETGDNDTDFTSPVSEDTKQENFDTQDFIQQERIDGLVKKEDDKNSPNFLRQVGSQSLFGTGEIFPTKNVFENGPGFDVGQPFDDAKSIFDADPFFDSKAFLEGDPTSMFDKRDLLDNNLPLDLDKTVTSSQADRPITMPPVVTSSDTGQATSVIQTVYDKPKPKGKTIKNIPGAKIFGSGKGKGKGGGKGKTSGKNSGKGGGRQRKTAGSGKKRKSSDSESFGSPAHSPTVLVADAASSEAIDLDIMKRRSLRERRKKNYKDDFDYNLSDEDDPKKKKGDIPPDGHKLIPYKPSEAIEGEIAIVEKILATRIRQSTNEDGKQVDEQEYFVKYKGYSYLHCEWGTAKELSKKDKRVAMKVKRFNSKSDTVAFLNQLDDEPFNPDYVEIDRVLDLSTYVDQVTGETVTHYLVKWVGLPYEDSTWELEMNVDEPKIEQYIELKKPPPPEKRTRVERPVSSDWQKIDKSPIYKNNNELREYQLEGLNWLLFCWYKKQNCILADEMGLGKTIQSITFLCAIKKYGVRGPFLVIAPLSTISNWQREFETWSDINAIVYHGTAPSRHLIQQYEMYYQDEKGEQIPDIYKFEAVITTYEMILSDNDILNAIPWRCLVIDEAHRLKNRNCKLLEGLNNLEVEHRVLLTGTPLQNNVEELFSLLNFLEPTRFPSQGAFLVEFGNLKTEAQVEKLQQILKPMMLRRLKEDVEKNIAPKEETIVEVELTTIQKKIYRAILEKNFSFLSKGASATNIPNLMNTMMELRKCCNHPFLINGAEERIVNEYTVGAEGLEKAAKQVKAMIESSGKMVLIDKLLPKLKAGGHKVLIFSQMIRVLDLIEDYLLTKRHAYERIDGRVRGNMRQAAIDRFCRLDSDRFVFLLCTRAGGLGINLTAADTVIIFDSDWNPQNDLQAQARCHRIGQEKSVKVYRLICRNTYEREMFDRASLKLGLDKAILQNMNAKDGTLSAPQQPAMSKKEIEDLLKKGAYGAIMDQEDNDASSKFCEEDIDLILERRTQIIQIVGEGKGSTFAKASFVSDKARLDVDIDDPDFWKKWAKKAAVDVDELCQDNLIIDKPRQRKQTRRFGNEDGPLDLSDFDSDEETPKEEPPTRTSWTRVECFKVEKNLLVYGWGRWKEIISSGHFRLQMTEKEVEAIARSILAYCQYHYKGDEKTKQFIVSLVESSAMKAGVPVTTNDEAYVPTGNGKMKSKKRKKGKPKKAQYSKPAIIEIGADWNAMEQETIVIDAGYRKHLQHHCNKILSRVRLLYCLWHDILGDVSEGIRDGCSANSIEFLVPYTDGEKPSPWWNEECDKSLLIGVHKHGYERYSQICCDPNLYFAEKLGLPAPMETQPTSPDSAAGESANKNEDSNDPDFVSPKRKKKRQMNTDEDEDENSDDYNSDYEKESSVVGASPMSVSSKDAASSEVLATSRSGLQMPLASDLNTRLRRLVASYLRSCEREQLTQIKAEKDKERREKIAQQAKDREAKKAVMAQKWSRREESDFYRVISTFGVVYDPKEKIYDWSKFRHLARLDKKDDDRITAYYEEFMAMCRRMCGKPGEGENARSSAGVTPVSEERANRCLQRVHLLRKIREEVLLHEKLEERIQLCQRSSEFPSWWENGRHDKELLVGVAKHGIGRTDYHLFTDPELSFKEILDSASVLKDAKDSNASHATGSSGESEDTKGHKRDSNSGDDPDDLVEEPRLLGRNKTRGKDSDISQADTPERESSYASDLGKPMRDFSDDPDGKSDLMPPTITDEAAEILSAWPKDRMVINRLEKITHCVLHGFWPKGVKSLDAAIAKLHSQHVPPLTPNLPPAPAIDRPNLVCGEPMRAIDEEMEARGEAEYAAGLNDKDFKIKRLDGLKLTVKKHKKRKKKDLDYDDPALGKLSIVPPPETAFSSRTDLRAEISEKLAKKILKKAALDEVLCEHPEQGEPPSKPKRTRRKRKAGDLGPPDLSFSPPLVDGVHMANEDHLLHDAVSQIKVPMISQLHIPRVNSSEHKTLPGAAVQLDDAMMIAAEKRGLIQVHYPKISKMDDSIDRADVSKARRRSTSGSENYIPVSSDKLMSASDEDENFSPTLKDDSKHSNQRWKLEDPDSPPSYPTSPRELARDITWKEILRETSVSKMERGAREPPVLTKAPTTLSDDVDSKTFKSKLEKDSRVMHSKDTRIEHIPLPLLKQTRCDVHPFDGDSKKEAICRASYSTPSSFPPKLEAGAHKKEPKGRPSKVEPDDEDYDVKPRSFSPPYEKVASPGEGRKKGGALLASDHLCLNTVPPATVASKKDHRRHTPKPSSEPSRVLPRREASVEASRLITAQEKGYVLPKLQPASCYARFAKSPPSLKVEERSRCDSKAKVETMHEVESSKLSQSAFERNDSLFSESSHKSASAHVSPKHNYSKGLGKPHSRSHGRSSGLPGSPKPKRTENVKAENELPGLKKVEDRIPKNFVIPKLSRSSQDSKKREFGERASDDKAEKADYPSDVDRHVSYSPKDQGANHAHRQSKKKLGMKHLTAQGKSSKEDTCQFPSYYGRETESRKPPATDIDCVSLAEPLSKYKSVKNSRTKKDDTSAGIGQMKFERDKVGSPRTESRISENSRKGSESPDVDEGRVGSSSKHSMKSLLSVKASSPLLSDSVHGPPRNPDSMRKRRKHVDEIFPIANSNKKKDEMIGEAKREIPPLTSLLDTTPKVKSSSVSEPSHSKSKRAGGHGVDARRSSTEYKVGNLLSNAERSPEDEGLTSHGKSSTKQETSVTRSPGYVSEKPSSEKPETISKSLSPTSQGSRSTSSSSDKSSVDGSFTKAVTLDVAARPASASTVSPSSGRPKLKLDAIVAKLSTSATKLGTSALPDHNSSPEVDLHNARSGPSKKGKNLFSGDAQGSEMAEGHSNTNVDRTVASSPSPTNSARSSYNSPPFNVEQGADTSTHQVPSKGRKSSNAHKYNRDLSATHAPSSPDVSKRTTSHKLRKEFTGRAASSSPSRESSPGVKRPKRPRISTPVDEHVNDKYGAETSNLNSPSSTHEKLHLNEAEPK